MSRLRAVSIRDLSRRPGEVLDRVAAGERQAVATGTGGYGPVRLPEHLWSEGMRSLGDLEIRGLARKTFRGWELTGRGLAMHEALRGRYGQDQTLPGPAYKKDRRSQSSG
jgi:hypothetical protein